MLGSPWNARVFVAALVALSVAGSPRPAPASGMTSSIEFSTSGTIGTTGMVGPQLLTFRGTSDGMLTTAGINSPFGQFVVQSNPFGLITTYNQTPFDIILNIKSVNGNSADAPAPMHIKGTLDGTASSDGFSQLHYSINENHGFPGNDTSAPLYPAIVAPFQVGDTLFRVELPEYFLGSISTNPKTVNDFTGAFYTEVVPEPTVLAMFATSIGLLLLNRSRLIATMRKKTNSA